MNLTLSGHDDRYAVEQLQMALFDLTREGEAVSALHRGKTWLTAVTTITCDGKTTRGVRRLKAEQETVRLRNEAELLYKTMEEKKEAATLKAKEDAAFAAQFAQSKFSME